MKFSLVPLCGLPVLVDEIFMLSICREISMQVGQSSFLTAIKINISLALLAFHMHCFRRSKLTLFEVF